METLKLFTPKQMQEADKRAIDEWGIPEPVLMEGAAMAALRLILKEFPAGPVLIIAGPGNNGGDGLALARLLSCRQRQVSVLLPEKINYKGASEINYQLLIKMDSVKIVTSDVFTSDSPYCLIVDALFGTGLSRQITGVYSKIIEQINNSASPVLSLDIPSGINGETGQIMGCAVKASQTIAFAAWKTGNWLWPGRGYCGIQSCDAISMHPEILNSFRTPEINRPSQIPPRKPDGHKGSYGRVLTIGGSERYLGAPWLTATAALKAGAGYSRLSSPEKVFYHSAIKTPELIYVPRNEIHEGLKLSTVAVLGPGMGISPDSREQVREVIQTAEIPLIIDADALTLVAEEPSLLNECKLTAVLTPHPGEMSRLTGLSVSEIQQNPAETAGNFSMKYGVYLVLKGATTVIATPDGRIFFNTSGSSALATAGTGDILAGLIAGLTGVLPLEEAVKTGVYFHGLAGERVSREVGDISSTASDILHSLTFVLKEHS